MATQKIILKTAKARKGTVSRAAIRKAVKTVFGSSRTTKSTRTTTKAATMEKAGARVLHAQ